MTDTTPFEPQSITPSANGRHPDVEKAHPDQQEDPTQQASAIKRAINAITRAPMLETSAPSVEMTAYQSDATPWILRQFFGGEIDLDVELAQRFENMPVMSSIKVREMGDQSRRSVATMAAQDGSAQVVIDVDRKTRFIQMAFTFGAMLTLRFGLYDLSDMDRQRWLNLMRRDQGGLAFLWGPSRWEKDYMICVSRRYFTNFYAFSPYGFEAAVRMTPKVTQGLLEWLESYWTDEDDEAGGDSTPLLTW